MARRGIAKPARISLAQLPDVPAIKDLLIWARRERISISQVTVGGVTIAGVYDRKMDADDGRKPMDAAREEVRSSIIEQYAGPLMSGISDSPDAETAEEVETTVEDDDDDE